ncbi:hypothetical protein [Nocardia wallacei]|uniref:hypothetical protein n=1 Tax=Nocardia wallacei TaxID=480035 RepID=UPI0024583071|nr:hypothetical protein [Nocardia wallacei]
MAEYAFLVCNADKTMLALGKAVKAPNGEISYFARGTAQAAANSQNPLLTKALWKFLAEHGHQHLTIVTDYDDDFETIAAYREIGGDEIDDISLDDYVAGWPG